MKTQPSHKVAKTSHVSRSYALEAISLLGGLLLVLLLQFSGLAGWLEELTVALRLELQLPPSSRNKVSVVAIGSDETLEHSIALRDALAPFLEQLSMLPREQQPQRIVLDLMLAFPPVPTADGAEESGQRVLKAAESLHKVVHPIMTEEMGSAPAIPDSALDLLGPHLWPNPGGISVPEVKKVRLAHPDLAQGLYQSASGIGSMTLPRHQEQNAPLFRLPLFSRIQTEPGAPTLLPGLAMAAVLSSKCEGIPRDECLQLTEGTLWKTLHIGTVQPIEVPLDLEGRFFIRYHRSFAPPSATFQALKGEAVEAERGCPSFVSLDQATRNLPVTLSVGNQPIPLERLRGCYVLVVDWLEEDGQQLPIGQRAREFTLHAQILANMLDEDFIRPLPPSVAWALTIPMLGAYLGMLALRRRLRADDAHLPADSSQTEQDSDLEQSESLASSSLVRHGLAAPAIWMNLLWWTTAHGTFLLSGILVPLVLPTGALLGASLTRQVMATPLLRRRILTIQEDKHHLEEAQETLHLTLQALEDELAAQARALAEAEAERVAAELQRASSKQEAEDAQQQLARQDEQRRLEHEAQLIALSEAETARLTVEAQKVSVEREAEALNLQLARQQEQNQRDKEAFQNAVRAEVDQQLLQTVQRAKALLPTALTTPRRIRSSGEDPSRALPTSLQEKLAALQAAVLDVESRMQQQKVQPGDIDVLTEIVHERFTLLDQLHQRVLDGMGELARIEKEAVGQLETPVEPTDVLTLQQPDPELEKLGFLTVDSKLAERIKKVLKGLKEGRGSEKAPSEKVLSEKALSERPLSERPLSERPLSERPLSPVLITGDVGTGKRTLARAVHAALRGALPPFVELEGCTLGPREFKRRLMDAAERAKLGTLYVNRLAAFSKEQQKGVIDLFEQRVGKAGSFMLICSCEGQIRRNARKMEALPLEESVYDRLFGRMVHLPPLQERREEIAPLSRYVLSHLPGEPVCEVTPEAILLLQNGHFWGQNRRELAQVLKELATEARILHASREKAASRESAASVDPAPLRCVVDEGLVLRWLNPALNEDLTRLEKHRLSRMQCNGFSTRKTSKDPLYSGISGRLYAEGTVDLHRCQLFAKVLVKKGYHLPLAVSVLAGVPDGPRREIVERKVKKWLSNIKGWAAADLKDRFEFYDAHRPYAEEVRQAIEQHAIIGWREEDDGGPQAE